MASRRVSTNTTASSGDGNGDTSQWNLDDYGRSGNASDDDDLPPLQIHESSTSLRDHLMAQLRVTQASQRDRALITFLIESLDDDGYLAATLEEVLADLPEELEVDRRRTERRARVAA